MSDQAEIEGVKPAFIERGIAAAYRTRSLESRAAGLLSLGVVCALGVGLLVWYYSAALKRPARAAETARTLAASRAQAEMPLPPLQLPRQGYPQPRRLAQLPPLQPIAPAGPSDRPLPWVPDRVPPPSSAPSASGELLAPAVSLTSPALGAPNASAAGNPHWHALERRLSGLPFTTHGAPGPSDNSARAAPVEASGPEAKSDGAAGALTPAGDLAQLLAPAVAPAVAARVLPTETLLLPKGAFIDCTLETAIDSELPGMTTCITATDTFGADGKVVLLERGSKLVGETRGEVRQGGSRVFVLWSEARTPSGIVIPLASPGTDELGRSGLPGAVNRHFLQRFGAALLISIIDAGAEAATLARNGAVIVSPTASEDVMSDVLKDTLRIPPTVVKHQGDRIQVLVARDVDFRSVYELRAQSIGR